MKSESDRLETQATVPVLIVGGSLVGLSTALLLGWHVTRVAPYLGAENMQPQVDDISIEIGCRHNSAAILSHPDGEPALHEHPRASLGRPGSRAPRVFLGRAGARLSTLDLFGREFVLLAGPDGGDGAAAAPGAARRLGVKLEAYQVGEAGELTDADGRFLDAYGISARGAVVVRPDGVVGWRTRDGAGASEDAVHETLASLLGRVRD